MGVKEFLSSAIKKDSRYKELEREMKIRKILEERQKNSNERELERFYEEERQKKIKKNLEEFRKARQEELWHGHNILEQKNIFKGGKSIMDQDKSILTDNKKLFTSKCKKSKGGMFFK